MRFRNARSKPSKTEQRAQGNQLLQIRLPEFLLQLVVL